MKVEVKPRLVRLLRGLDPLYGDSIEERLDAVLLNFFINNAENINAVRRLPGRRKR